MENQEQNQASENLHPTPQPAQPPQPVSAPAQPQQAAQVSGYSQQPPAYQSQQVQYASQSISSGKATGALVCGILAIVFCGLPIVGIILGVVALILASKATREGDMSGKKTGGKVCGGIGIGLSVIALILWITLIVSGMALLNAVGTYANDVSDDSSITWEYSSDTDTIGDEAAAMAAVEEALSEVSATDDAYVQELAEAFESEFYAGAGFELSELGVDAEDIAEWILSGIDYDVEDATLFSDGTGFVDVSASCRDIDTWMSAFEDEVDDLVADSDTYVDIIGSEDDLYTLLGDALISTMNSTTAMRDVYLAIDVTENNGTWEVDQSSLESELEYLFNL